MTSKRELTYQSLREQLYAACRYDTDIMMVEVDQMAIILGLEPPDDGEPDMDTAEMTDGAMMAIARHDAAMDDTQPCVVPVYDDIDTRE